MVVKLKEAVAEPLVIDSRGVRYPVLNEMINEAVRKGAKNMKLVNVNGQRYIADGLVGDIDIEIHGTPGDDLGSFMHGPRIVVHGSAQDGTGNTMNSGEIIIYGDARDITGHSMRGGNIYINGDVGYRVGIHMKEYEGNYPVVVAAGNAGDFLGEYMAGGRVVILGIKEGPEESEIVGDWVATGIHGGIIYVRGEVEEDRLGIGAKIMEYTKEDEKALRGMLEGFCEAFGYDLEEILKAGFTKITPISHRPFGKMYTE
ncbi:MAG: hypothetical protein ACE5G7_05485 [Candidatus Hydrothermarchaeaceae archaeon]